MRSTTSIYMLCLFLPCPAWSGDPDVDSIKLQKLHQSSQQQLEIIQNTGDQETTESLDEHLEKEKAEKKLDNQQKTEQFLLQQKQSGEQAKLKHHKKVAPTGPADDVKSTVQQQQFRQEQQNQLNRFKNQQQTQP